MSTNSLLFNAPNNIRGGRDDEKCNQGIFSSAEKKAISKFRSGMLRFGVHENIFCSLMPYKQLCSIISKRGKMQEATGQSGSESN